MKTFYLLLSSILVTAMPSHNKKCNTYHSDRTFLLANNESEQQCTGTLIAKNYILTAAHCKGQVQRIVLETEKFKEGKTYKYLNTTEEIELKGIERNDEHFPSDSMILKFLGDSSKKVADLPLVDGIEDRNGAIAIGYGTDETGSPTNECRYIEVARIPDPDSEAVKKAVNQGYLAFKDLNGNDPTRGGDSGGPILNNNFLVGTLFGGKDGYSVYQPIRIIKPWIEAVLKGGKEDFIVIKDNKITAESRPDKEFCRRQSECKNANDNDNSDASCFKDGKNICIDPR